MTQKLSIRDLNLKNRKVLIRVDFNVPLEKGEITDDSRIKAALPTIKYALDQGGLVILMSHLGRPKGKIDPKFSLLPCAQRLSELLQKPVKMAGDCQGTEVENKVATLKPGEILLLENLRFYPAEENPDQDLNFVKNLAKLGDVYINDAFGTAHRFHASTAVIAQFFPEQAATGLLIEKEIKYLGEHLLHPQRPFCAILGGAKISTKFKTIKSLMQKADVLLIGGAMSYTFFKAKQVAIGQSLVEDEFLQEAHSLMEESLTSSCELILPLDLVITKKIKPQAEYKIIEVEQGISTDFQGVDIGPKTIELYQKKIQQSATLFWNGPMGVFECPPFDQGTVAIAKALSNHQSAITIVGGGDSIAALEKSRLTQKMSHVSTGGGASLEYIEQGKLPGIEALSNKMIENSFWYIL